MDRDERRRSERFLASASTRIALGVVLGGVVGALFGAIAGSLWLPDRPAAIAAAILGGVVIGVPLGAYWAEMSRLESPQPGLEPSQTDDPLQEEDLTTEEHPSSPSLRGNEANVAVPDERWIDGTDLRSPRSS